ncbi:MAG TPA: response regulator [Mucilaginibacter sp.]|jgi:DNA-binding response OmpR family regulator
MIANAPVTILIVDDDPDIRSILVSILDMEGWHSVELDNGHDVFMTIQQQNPNVILLDVMLGDLDGRDICRELKNSTETKNIPIMIVSATHGYSDTESYGANDYLGKPFDLEDLVFKVKRMLAGC